MESQKILSKILVCLYVIIALLAINTLVVIVANVDSSSNSDSNDEIETNGEYDVSMFKEISADDFKEVASSSDKQVIYIGRETCSYCVAFLPTLQKAQEEYGYTTKYLDITTITTEEQQNTILGYDNEEEFLSTNFGSTPMILIMQDGKLINGWVGYDEYDSFASFLEENGITK